MQGEDIARDPLDKVSGQLRKAVGLNRHEIGGLRSVMSQMNRERNKSVGLLSKQQQDFLQKQARLLPALNARKKFKRAANQVIPLNQEQTEPPKVASPKVGVAGISSAPFNVLPPIRSSRLIPCDPSGTESDAKQRRISDYKKEFSTLQESISNAHRFALGGVNDTNHTQEGKQSEIQETEISTVDARQRNKVHLQSSAEQNNRSREVSRRVRSKDSSSSGIDSVAHGSRRFRKRSDETALSPRADTKVKTNNTILINDEVERVALANKPTDPAKETSVIYEEDENTKRSYWEVVRERLGLIAAMNKKRHSQYLEHLYEEIRKCRYIRRPRRRNPSTGLWYESGEESDAS